MLIASLRQDDYVLEIEKQSFSAALLCKFANLLFFADRIYHSELRHSTLELALDPVLENINEISFCHQQW